MDAPEIRHAPDPLSLDAEKALDPYPAALPTARELEALRRWTRQDWIAYGLRTLERGGIQGVRIEEMARRSGRTPGSFYGYFSGRDVLLEEMAVSWQTFRVAQVEWTHRHLRRTGRYTLTGVIDDFEHRVKGEWFIPDLDLNMRLWARQDARAARAVRALDRLRLVAATEMARAEGLSAEYAPQAALILNWVLAGRHIVFLDPDGEELKRAATTALEDWAARTLPPSTSKPPA